MQQQPRKILSLRAGPQNVDPADPAALLRSAIERKLCIRAVYNKGAVEVAPHALYSKHGDPFVDGVVLLRDGKPPKEAKLGTFKLAGLSGLAFTNRRFEPSILFDGGDPKYAEAAIRVAPLE